MAGKEQLPLVPQDPSVVSEIVRVSTVCDHRRKLLDCICAILGFNVILEYSFILEFGILYSSIAATSG